MEWLTLLRWLHIVVVAAWFGELVMVNLVLVPALGSLQEQEKVPFAQAVFPRVFTLASWLSIIAVLSGFLMLGITLDWTRWGVLLEGRWGLSVLVGGSLGLGLTLFHHIAERRLAPTLEVAGNPGPQGPGFVYIERRLRLIPRVGVVVLLLTMGAMMYAARGF